MWLPARGSTDVRPAHGFAFARIAAGGATTGELATHLGVSKQAAAQMVTALVQKGYVRRRTHPADGRARLLVLTKRGVACTQAAEACAAEAAGQWVEVIGRSRLSAMAADLASIGAQGPLRPAW